MDDQTSDGCLGDEDAGLEGVPREVLYSDKRSVVCLCIHFMLSPSEVLINDHDAVHLVFLTGCSG